MITPRRMNKHFIVSVALGLIAGGVVALFLVHAFSSGDHPFDEPGGGGAHIGRAAD